MRNYLGLVLILFLASILRFWQLGIVPAGITHDELGYVYNAYSISQTGKNVFGEFLPFFTWLNKGGWPFLPVPIYLSVPFFWIFDISATVGRLPSAIIGVFDVFLLFVLVKQIFNKTSFALLSALFLAISPWHLHFSRSAYDPNFALFFYLLGIVTFIYEVKNKKLPILSVVAMLFAVFSYRGTNILFLPLITLLILYGLKVLRMTRKQVVVFTLGACLILLSFLAIVTFNGKAYTAEALVWNDPKMQESIDTQIRESQGPLFVRRLFLNKPMYVINKLRENYVRAYSPEFLFLYTEPSKIYSIWSRGRLYFLDLIFIILGIAYLYKLNKHAATFVVGLLLIGGLPGMFGGFPYSARNFFLSAFLPVLSAGGILFLLHSFFFKRVRRILICALILVYAYVFGSYLFDYYGRYALYGTEAWAKSLKDLSFTILENKHQYNTIVVGTTSFGDLMQYAFYAKVNPSDVQKAWQNKEKENFFTLGNVSFMSECLDFEKEERRPLLYIVHENCNKTATPSGLIKDYPGNTVWKIYSIGQ